MSAKGRPRWHVIILYAVLIGLGLGILIFGCGAPERRTDSTAVPGENLRQKRSADAVRNQTATVQTTASSTDDSLIDDDGKTLWVSPTDGPPIDLGYLSPGAQIVVALRPADIARHPESQRILSALGPLGQRVKASLEQLAKVELPKLNQLVIGVETRSNGAPLLTLVIRASETLTLEKLARSTGQKPRREDSGEYIVIDDVAYFIPDGSRTTLVVTPAASIADIIALAGDPPLLRRDVERLVAHTDDDRQVTVICTPNSLFSEGRSLFETAMPRLRAPLFWFLGDELSAVALSANWDENFLYEVVAVPTLETSPEQAARILSERLREAPDRVKRYVSTLRPSAYGQEVVTHFPAMIEMLAKYSRSSFDRDHAVLRGYLPVTAGHNLLLGGELVLAEAPSQGRPVAEATSPGVVKNVSGDSVLERLRKVTSLRFGRETLQAALDQLSKDIGVAIEIRGADLQAEGITKNQQFGIDVANKPAEEILVEILRLANPDKTASGPRDVKQELVYVIGTGGADEERIIVTTRAAAAARGEDLPEAFR
jgi:hypothetical protein